VVGAGVGGQVLPTITTCRANDAAGVSQVTVRRAIAQLRERGKVVTVHGRGTYVAMPRRKPPARIGERDLVL